MGDWQDIFNPAKWLENISEVGQNILKPLLNSVTGMFKKDGILSGEMLGTVFQALVFSEIFGKTTPQKMLSDKIQKLSGRLFRSLLKRKLLLAQWKRQH